MVAARGAAKPSADVRHLARGAAQNALGAGRAGPRRRTAHRWLATSQAAASMLSPAEHRPTAAPLRRQARRSAVAMCRPVTEQRCGGTRRHWRADAARRRLEALRGAKMARRARFGRRDAADACRSAGTPACTPVQRPPSAAVAATPGVCNGAGRPRSSLFKRPGEARHTANEKAPTTHAAGRAPRALIPPREPPRQCRDCVICTARLCRVLVARCDPPNAASGLRRAPRKCHIYVRSTTCSRQKYVNHRDPPNAVSDRGARGAGGGCGTTGAPSESVTVTSA